MTMASHIGKRTRKISVKTCVVCCEDEQFYAIGACDHWVCYKCCVRMRVLGNENYCSVCRTDLDQVFLTRKPVPYAELMSKGASFGYFDKRYGIRYADGTIEEAVKKLLQHCCPICPDRPPERSFNQLRSHVRKAHEMYYCDLCVAHLRKYTYERKIYTRPDLARHRRRGDADDKSYKGHPLCEFCDDRYLDNDELHRHLRKVHFWCHFCERDGGQQYYPDYLHLREHFREEHFLCEEDDCIHEKFTSVFCTKVDLQSHIAVKHANKLSKAEAWQARQLDVDLQFAPRPRAGPSRRNHASRDAVESWPKEQRQVKAREDKTQNRHEGQKVQEASALSSSDSTPASSTPMLLLSVDVEEFQPTQSDKFPLRHAPQDTVNTSNYAKENRRPESKKLENQKIKTEDFPSLPTAPSKTNPTRPPPPGLYAAAAKPVVSSEENKKSKPAGRAKPPGLELSVEPPGLLNGRGNSEENVHPPSNQSQEGTSNTQGRNQVLVENIKALLGHSDVKFTEFKRLSGSFRQGAISAKNYYEECFKLFGSKFSQVFFELVDLLPDQVKRQELLNAHQDAKVVAKKEGKININGSSTRKEVPGAWNSAAAGRAAQPARPIIPASNKPVRSSGLSVASEHDFPSLPPATGKKYVRPLYKGSKPAPVLKEAWVRGK